MSRVLIAFSSVDGQTLKICEYLLKRLQQDGHSATLLAVDARAQAELQSFDKIVIGASIRYGKHRQVLYDFIRLNRQALENKPSAFFSVNVVARKAGKDSAETNPYIASFRQQTPWRPSLTTVFAGRINYPSYGFVDREIIRLIMWLTHGPTDRSSNTEFTNWDRVDAFARQIGAL